jgi:hypothetical protein
MTLRSVHLPLAAAAVLAIAGVEPDPPVGLPEFSRDVRRFDFEERSEQPFEFPLRFQRVGPFGEHPRDGFPPFGQMSFSPIARSGSWSFRFDLESGSMAAATLPNTIPVIPGADYAIAGWIRTVGIVHARARLVTSFLDHEGRTIEGSTVSSELTKTDGEWRHVAINTTGVFSDAVDLVLELQVLQRDQFAGPDADEPLLQDVAGSVWFDDFTVRHLPRVELSAGASGHVFFAPQQPSITIAVSDLASEPIEADLTVRSLRGAVVMQRRIPIRRGRHGQVIPIDDLELGWYEVIMSLRSGAETLDVKRITLACLPPVDERRPRAEKAIGVSFDGLSLAQIPAASRLIEELRLPTAVLPVWDADYVSGASDSRFDAARTAIERLLDSDVNLVLSVPCVPTDLAEALVLDESDVLDLFAGDPAIVRPTLDPILIVFGQQVRDWQIGRTMQTSAFWRDDLHDALARTHATLSRLVPGPRLIIPWSIEQMRHDSQATTSRHLVIPYHIAPEAIPPYVEPWTANGADVLVTLEQLPIEGYDHMGRTLDLILRTLHAWRAGVKRLLIESPWTWDDDGGEPSINPDPSLPCWMVMSRMLTGRRFGGEVPLGTGLRCWQFDGADGSILVAWNETAPHEAAGLDATLSTTSITVTDWLGNQMEVAPIDRRHVVPLGRAPVFIEGIDPYLARFRQRFAIEPAFARSVPRDQSHELVLSNPWTIAATGSVRFVGPAEWTFSPRHVSFTIPAGEEIRIPFLLRFGRNETAGPKRVEVDVEIAAHETYSLVIASELVVGLEEIEVNASWRVATNARGEAVDLVISAHITNRADTPINLEASALAPGFSRMHRTASRVPPGETVVKTFLLPDGAIRLAGRSIQIGVGPIDTPGRVNTLIAIPESAATAGVSDGRP